MSATIAVFGGEVSCDRERQGPLGLTLTGPAADRPEEMLTVAFAGRAPADLPEFLTDVLVIADDGRHYRISRPPREWRVEANAAFVHRDVGAAFYRAIPPLAPPLGKRLLWSLLLWLAAGGVGRGLLLALRRRRARG
jgi:hypothetical protein